jgi:hypothetical protein
MRYVLLVLSALLLSCSLVLAQGNASGRGSVKGDPAASSANPRADPNTTRGQGSGMQSTSGGKDDNGDQGRDKAPNSGTGHEQQRRQR